jgi:hypothetical protein
MGRKDEGEAAVIPLARSLTSRTDEQVPVEKWLTGHADLAPFQARPL